MAAQAVAGVDRGRAIKLLNDQCRRGCLDIRPYRNPEATVYAV